MKEMLLLFWTSYSRLPVPATLPFHPKPLFFSIPEMYNINEYKSKTFCTYVENMKLATEKPKLHVKDYLIEFALSIVHSFKHKKICFLNR